MTFQHIAGRHLEAARNIITVADWIQISILFVAAAAVIVPLYYRLREKEQERVAVRGALLQEMLANLHGLFNEGIERPFLFKVFEGFIEKLSSKIKDESEFQKLISLYTDLMDYRAVTDQFWPPSKTGYPDAHILCTQKQVQTINKFLAYFGEPKVDDAFDLDSLKKSREKARGVRDKKQKKWHQTLEDNIKSII